jgi:hypothetical protein
MRTTTRPPASTDSLESPSAKSITAAVPHGDKAVEVWTDGDFEMTGAGTYSQANVGDVAYVDDNYTMNLSIGSTSVPAGRVVGYVSTTKLIVAIRPTGDGASACCRTDNDHARRRRRNA